MSSIHLWGYGLVLGASLALSLLLTPLALNLAVRLGILDRPGPRKGHSQAVPYLGGAAIVLTFVAVVLVAAALRPPPSRLLQLVGFLGLAFALAVMGLVDDVRRGLSPRLRFVIEAAAAFGVWTMGDAAHLAGVPGWLDAVLSVVWIVGITNAFNLLDNMDGLSAGVAALAALTVFGIAAVQGRYLVAALAVALAGCATGFLRHNFHPAKIYMGDAGSLFLGFTLAVLLLKLRDPDPDRVLVAVLLAIPAVAIFDTLLVVVARLSHHRSPFLGGQDHTSHRLVRSGLSVRQSVAVIYVASAACDGAAMAMWRLGRDARVVGVIGVVGAAIVAGVLLLRIPVYAAGEGSTRRSDDSAQQAAVPTDLSAPLRRRAPAGALRGSGGQPPTGPRSAGSEGS